MTNDRVLITGSSGVIGRELLAILARSGADVLSVDRLPLPMPTPDGVQHRQVDLATHDLAFIWDFRPRRIFHLAASFERADETPDFWDPNWHDNVVVSHRLADGARQAGGVDVLVFASSYLVYDPAQYLSGAARRAPVVLSEAARVDPRNLCGAAKLYAEKEYAFAQAMFGAFARVAMARIFRVYGRGSRDIVSRWVRAALADEPLVVYQRENMFDYIFAGDVASALAVIAESDGAEGVINVGTGRSSRIHDVLEALAASLDVDLEAEDHPSRGAYEASCADISLLRERTGWEPAVRLPDGIAAVIEHERGT